MKDELKKRGLRTAARKDELLARLTGRDGEVASKPAEAWHCGKCGREQPAETVPSGGKSRGGVPTCKSCWSTAKMLADHQIHFHSLDLDVEHSRSFYRKIADMRQEAQSLGATLRFEKVKEALEAVLILYRKAVSTSVTKKPWRPMPYWTRKGFNEASIREHAPMKTDSIGTELFKHSLECESEKDIQASVAKLLARNMATPKKANSMLEPSPKDLSKDSFIP